MKKKQLSQVLFPLVMVLPIITITYSAGLRHFSIPEIPLAVISIVLTVLLFLLLREYERRWIRPVLAQASSASKWIITAASIFLAALTVLQFPLKPEGAGLSALNPAVKMLYAAGFFTAALVYFSLFLFVLAVFPRKTDRFLIFAALFVLIFSIGLFVYDDYGISFDEIRERITGQVNFKHVLKKVYPGYLEEHLRGIEDLAGYRDLYYGAAFQLPIVALEEFNDVEGESIWFFHHFWTFLFFDLGAAAFFLLIEEIFDRWQYAAAGTLFFILTPRIFANGFYNVKDAVFLASFTFAFYFGARLVKKPGWGIALAFAGFSALAANMRIIGIFFFGVLLLAAFLSSLIRREKKDLTLLLLTPFAFLAVYIVGSSLFYVGKAKSSFPATR